MIYSNVVIRLASKEARKFNEWAEKIRSTLKSLPDEAGYAALPDECKLLRDWGMKLQRKDFAEYAKARKTEIDLLSKSACQLHHHFEAYLDQAKKHKLGTKARMKDVLRYVYCYIKNVHPNLLRAEKEERASEYLKSFWGSYLKEIYLFIESGLLDDFKIECIRMLTEQSRDVSVGLEFVDKLISKLELEIMKPKRLFRILKGFYHVELLVIADALSGNRKKWDYDKRSKTSMAEAIVQNCSETDLFNWFKKYSGKKLPKEMQREELEVFPSAVQVGKFVLGPLGLIEGTVKRSRSGSETTRIVLEQYLGKEQSLRSIWKELEREISTRLPDELWQEPTSQKQKIIQVILAHAKDEKICIITNRLLEQGKIRIKVSALYDDDLTHSPWVVTKHGLFIPRQGKASVENLADLLKKEFNEEDLASELVAYHGDFESKILEYCIKENPEEILTRMFGLISLKKIARNLGFGKVDSLHNAHDIATLILLKLGFIVPPSLTGLQHYKSRLQNCKIKITSISDPRMKSGLMSQAYVDMEGFLKNLLFFYVGFLWSKEIEDIRWPLGYGDAVKRILKMKLQIQNPERITFGETIHAIRRTNARIKDTRKLRDKTQKAFDRTWILQKSNLEILDKISGQRSRFVHFEKFSGDRICIELIDDMLGLLKSLEEEKIFPLVIRIVAEVADDYGKNYVRAIDENGNEWIIYSDKWLDATVPYFMHSKTKPIAVNPILVQKMQ